MKNIVTIDFDIIMAPCIELYNDFAGKRSWKELMSFDQMKMLTANLKYYQQLTNWIIKIIKQLNKEDIIFLEDHGQIVKHLISYDEKINIFNIDHHHDCGYPKDENEINPKLNCGNWGLILNNMNVLNNFYWIHDYNSNFPPQDKKRVNFIHFLLDEFDLDSLPIPDKLIICLSEPWVPPMFRPLFFCWLDILNEYYNTVYTIDFERC